MAQFMEGSKKIDYYSLNEFSAESFNALITGAVQDGLTALQNTGETNALVSDVLKTEAVRRFLIEISRQSVFSNEFAMAFQHNLHLLAALKQLKYFYNLPIGGLFVAMSELASHTCGDEGVRRGWEEFSLKVLDCTNRKQRTRDIVESTSDTQLSGPYLENAVFLEQNDPHAVYPTSIYRQCDATTLASPNASTIEAVMSTTLTTTIKIERNLLDQNNLTLYKIYKPLGRVVAVIDDKVESLFGEKLQAYLSFHGIELVKLVCSGNEIDKDLENVEQILVFLKKNGVSRNEPVMIVGGGVVADLGGFACSLYHRNTPYVMLCTSIVSGIDAGPSPRTCCDGYGYKNLYGAYHPPVVTLTDRSFWRTLHPGWLRHGVAEIIKMAVVKDAELFRLLEQANHRLIETRFGADCPEDAEFNDMCDLIVGKAMEGYVRSEYGNLFETHQCRPHAYGHTWSPGYELPAGMLHGHAIATCMGFGAFLSLELGWIPQGEFDRILKLLSDMELSLWHPIMENVDMIYNTQVKIVEKRGGNLAAPLPRPVGRCGYLNDLSREQLVDKLARYRALVAQMPRGGLGVEVHLHEVGLADTSAEAQRHVAAEGVALAAAGHHEGDAQGAAAAAAGVKTTYAQWIQSAQTSRNKDWEVNVTFEAAADTPRPPAFEDVLLFKPGVEEYAMRMTSVPTPCVQEVARATMAKEMFAPCMVGTLESQFLKTIAQVAKARRVLDVGTFTGMSAVAFAEGLPSNGEVVTLECYPEIAQAAQENFNRTQQKDKIRLMLGNALDSMRELAAAGEKFDIVFLDADKENYVAYYKVAMEEGLLAEDGMVLADNSLCALLYDAEDERSTRLHEFNQYVKNDPTVDQVVLTVREGVTMITRKQN
uniref:3-dehydroquinate synthase domain-containing protein n=1 Tax=Heterosigma akashiwo TaxID=2829 RepID=A0A7S3XWX0_HETAK